MSDQLATLIEHVLIALVNAASVVVAHWLGRRQRRETPHKRRGENSHTD